MSAWRGLFGLSAKVDTPGEARMYLHQTFTIIGIEKRLLKGGALLWEK